MKFAFCLLTHKSPDNLFEELLTFLNSFSNSAIIVHHDETQCAFDEDLVNKYDLHMVTPSLPTRWGHISKIPAMISTYQKALEVLPDFDWLITLSANCYPIKSMEFITTFFENSNYDYYLESHPLGLEFEGIYKWHYQTLFTKYIGKIPFITRKGKPYMKALRIPLNIKKTGFKDFKPYTGADWLFLNRKTVNRICHANIPEHEITNHVKVQNEAPDMNASPDEIIIQTFVKNQNDLSGCDKYYRYIDWEGTIDWHPKTLTLDDWDKIKNSDALFARKFDAVISKDIISKINTELLKNETN